MLANVCRPVHRSTLAEQLQRTLRMPQQSKTGLGKILGKVAKTALSGVAVYVVINVLSGKTGQKRLRQDFAIVTVSFCCYRQSCTTTFALPSNKRMVPCSLGKSNLILLLAQRKLLFLFTSCFCRVSTCFSLDKTIGGKLCCVICFSSVNQDTTS